MSTEIVLRGALMAALRDHAPLADAVNGIYAAPVIRPAIPYVELGPIAARDWSTKTEPGRELRFALSIFDQDERAERLAELMAEAETAIAALPRDLSGWRVASCVFLRGRVDRSTNSWRGIIDYRVRMLAV
ncbi:DUF3168 domain-containing protein [Parasphingopyxis sp.]|uniref:DUF3168 domain-containing protein n=1 Tax=Parasphingopyxis sp. TaxID=1920299 RepID=UPI002630C238|nr:DUF3168 domain-containing protein [Parasphingopyxis sp.]